MWEVVNTLANDIPLEFIYNDHPLKGKRRGSRECHIAPDLLLVYRLEGTDILWLDRLGSHSEILTCELRKVFEFMQCLCFSVIK